MLLVIGASLLGSRKWLTRLEPLGGHLWRRLAPFARKVYPPRTRLQAYAAGVAEDFSDVVIDMDSVTPFQRRVVQACRAIPYGETRTYGELAAAVGVPQAARAVGNVMAANRTPLIVPCHRVITSSGVLGRYSAGEGTRTKLRLIETEAQARVPALR